MRDGMKGERGMKYKVGDKVRVAKEHSVFSHSVRKGDIGVIKEVREGGDLILDFNGLTNLCFFCNVDENLEPATLSTGDMINALMANPEQRYRRQSNGFAYGLDKSGTIKCLENNTHWYSADLTDKWTLLPEPPKPVDFLTAVKAYAEGKTIVCNIDSHDWVYSPDASKMCDYGFKLCTKDGRCPVAVGEILRGNWFIKED
jgi:hypothetical protein